MVVVGGEGDDEAKQAISHPPTPLSPIKSNTVAKNDLVGSREAMSGVVEPTALDCDYFVNTHNPRLSATLLFSPNGYLCWCLPSTSSLSSSSSFSRQGDHSHITPPLHFGPPTSSIIPHVAPPIPSSYQQQQQQSLIDNNTNTMPISSSPPHPPNLVLPNLHPDPRTPFSHPSPNGG